MAYNSSYSDDVSCDEVIFGEILLVLDKIYNNGDKKGLFKEQS